MCPQRRYSDLDRVIVTDDDPSGEDGDAIVADIVAGFSKPAAVVVERNRRKVIARAVGEAGADDIVLIAGKGHETYQDVAGVKHPFDDSQVARELLEGRRSEEHKSELQSLMRDTYAVSCLQQTIRKAPTSTHSQN